MEADIHPIVQEYVSHSVVENLFYLAIYSLGLIAASAWAAHLAFRRGKSEKLGEIEAISAKQDDILKQLKASTSAVQLITNELDEHFSMRGTRRERLEQLVGLAFDLFTTISHISNYACSGQLIPDSSLGFSSASAGGNPPLY